MKGTLDFFFVEAMQTNDSFTLEFPSVAPRVAWALAADTNRASRAMGLAAGVFTSEVEGAGQVVQVGHGSQLGLAVAWVTGPDSWVEGAWYRTVRRYRKGPAQEAVIDYVVEPWQKGTRLTVTRRTSGNLLAACFDRYRVSQRLRKYLSEAIEVAARCPDDPTCGQPASTEVAKAFAHLPPGLVTGAATPTNLGELEVRSRVLREKGVSAELVDELATYLSRQPDDFVADLSPARFAEWAERPSREVLRLFVLATGAGLIELRWSMRCQTCKTSAGYVATLEDLPAEVKCPGCSTTFGPDLAAHVEASFSIQRGLRRAFVQKYCTAGATSRPQVFAQLVASPGAPCEVEAPLLEGALTLRVLGTSEPQPLPRRPATLDVTVKASGVSVEVGPSTGGATKISVRCEGVPGPAIVLLERPDWGESWVSAAELATVSEFHELFGGQAPRTRHEVSVGTLTMLFTDLRGSTSMYQRIGDARAFTLVSDHFDRLARAIEANEGALIKTMGDAVMAVFQTPPAAVRAAIAMQRAIAESETGAAGLILKLGVHSGNCLAVRANGRLDFFGHHVNLAARAQAQSHGGDIVITEAVRAHPGVAPLLQGLEMQSFEATLKGIDGPQRLWRVSASFGDRSP